MDVGMLRNTRYKYKSVCSNVYHTHVEDVDQYEHLIFEVIDEYVRVSECLCRIAREEVNTLH